MMIDILDALAECLTLDDVERHELGGIGLARRHLGEVHIAAEHLGLELLHIGNLGHRADGKLPQMRVHDQWLCIGITDDTYT